MTIWVPGTVIDVSKWQSSLPSLVGVIGVIARAGIGTAPDVKFKNHIADARAAGKWVGSYWFGWGALSVSDQVDAYIAREQEVGGVSLHVLDWESAEGLTAAQAADFIRIYKSRAGEPIALYASESRFRDLGQDWNWIANYSNEPTKAYDMWQYGPFRGVDGNHATQRILDLVAGATDMARFINLKGIEPAPVRTVNVASGHDWLFLDGSVGGTFTKDVTLSVLGRSDSDAELLTVVISTAKPYSDGVERPTAVNVAAKWTNTVAVVPPVVPPAAPADCSAVEAELANAKATIDEQAAIIAAEKTARLTAEQSLAVTYQNIDSLKA